MQTEQMKDEPNMVCVALLINYKTQREVHCAIYNQNLRLLQVCQFNDNDNFSNIESLIIQLHPKENQIEFRIYVEFPEIEEERNKIEEKLGTENVIRQIKYKAKENYDIQQTLEFLLKNPINTYYRQTKSEMNMVVLSSLLKQVQLSCQSTNKNSFDLQILNLKLYMKLDYAAINALQIFPKKMQKKVISTNETLFDILNRCKTVIGTRCLKRWMKQPLQSVQAIQKRLDFVKYFLENPEMKTAVQQELLSTVTDLEKLYFTFYKVKSGKTTKCELSDLIKLYKLIIGLRNFQRTLQRRTLTDFEKTNLYEILDQNVSLLDKPAAMIENNIVMEGRESEFFIKPSTHQSLKRITKEKQEANKSIQRLLEETKQQLGIQIVLVPSSNHFLFEGAKAEVQQALKNNKSYKTMNVKSNRFTFTNNQLARLCSEITRLDQQYEVQQKEVLKKMFAVVASFYEILQIISKFISQLDVYTTFASIISSEPGKWACPSFGDSLIATDIIHPCVSDCVPNSIKLSQNKTVIITGPNMGGKSTFIRTIGIGSYLSHIGFFVPASHFQTPIIDAIITRVGASDVQLKGISTFMSQMLETSCMLKIATENSLVLIDELGRGTSTHEGFGIAWAICEEVHNEIRPFCLFATHFHEMTKMPEEIKGVVNMYVSCKISDEKLIMEYKIQPGKIQKSYGIDLAEMIGFPDVVVREARRFAADLENFEDQLTSQSKLKKKMEIQSEQSHDYSVEYSKKLKIIHLYEEYRSQGWLGESERVIELKEQVEQILASNN